MQSLLVAVLVSILFISSSDSAATEVAALDDGLVAHYPLDGNAYDESGNDNHGEAYGSPIFVPGVMGQAAKFDGLDDIIRLPSGLLTQESFSISIYIKPGDGNFNSGGKPHRIFDAWTNGEIVALEYGESISRNTPEAFVDYRGTGNYLVGSFHPAYSDTMAFGERHIFDKVSTSIKTFWHHIVLNYDGMTAKFYLDGELVREYEFDEQVRTYFSFSQGRSNYLASINYTLGASLRNSTFYSGLIDEVRIYDRAISPQEIQELAKPIANACQTYCNPQVTEELDSLLDEPVALNIGGIDSISPLDGRKRNLVVLWHGWRSKPAVWPDASELSIKAALEKRNKLCSSSSANPCWDVVVFDWEDKADTLFPPKAYLHAGELGDEVAKAINEAFRGQLEHLHLIGHSAGSNAIQHMANWFSQRPTSSLKSIQMTFLDPYTPTLVDADEYGATSRLIAYSESYVTIDEVTEEGIAFDGLSKHVRDRTRPDLLNAYNFVIDKLDASVPTPSNTKEAAEWAIQNHAFPYQFYWCSSAPGSANFQNAEGVVEPCPNGFEDYGFGYGLSPEANDANSLFVLQSNYPKGDVCYATSTTICVNSIFGRRRTEVKSEDVVMGFPQGAVSDTGSISLTVGGESTILSKDILRTLDVVPVSSIQSLKATPNSPAWIRFPVYANGRINFIKFKFKFEQGGNSYLRVFLHGKQIYGVRQSAFDDGQTWETPYIGLDDLPPGSYELAFRVDPMSDVKSYVEVSEMSFGWRAHVDVPNVAPLADAGIPKTVRLGSVITLDGSASNDSDNAPGPLTYDWSQTGGPVATLNQSSSVRPVFSATTQGAYRFSLIVSDGEYSSAPSAVLVTVPPLGDIDLDGDVDNDDLRQVLAARNQPASGPNDLLDLDGTMLIDALDARKLVTLCTRSRCATQ